MKRFQVGAAIALLAFALQGCEVIEEQTAESPFQKLTGDAIVKVLGSTIGKVVQELEDVVSEESDLRTPSRLKPPPELFAVSEAVSTAPGIRPLYYLSSSSPTWEGPEVGPDGKSGWYFREATDSVTDSATGESEILKWRYWLRVEPAADLGNGLADVQADYVHYGWTAETGEWEDWRYLFSFGITRMNENAQGEVGPAAAEGVWAWQIGDNAPAYRGSKAEGSYRYSFVTAKQLTDFLVYGSNTNEIADPYFGLATGESRILDLTFDSESSAEGVFVLDDATRNEWFSGRLQKSIGNAELNHGPNAQVSAVGQWTSNAVHFHGRGALPSNADFTEAPGFVSGTVPAGDDWGVSLWLSEEESIEPRDGLIYWGESSHEIEVDAKWNAAVIASLQEELVQLLGIYHNPTSPPEEHSKAKIRMSEIFNEERAAFDLRNRIERYDGKLLKHSGEQSEEAWVRCSEPNLATDCP